MREEAGEHLEVFVSTLQLVGASGCLIYLDEVTRSRYPRVPLNITAGNTASVSGAGRGPVYFVYVVSSADRAEIRMRKPPPAAFEVRESSSSWPFRRQTFCCG